jgi:antitoxin component of MazEF toxin-antitoxin module
MKVKIRKIGNDEGFIIPKKMLAKFGWKAGDQLALSITNGILSFQAAEIDIESQVEAARSGMDKYKLALSKLADS